MRSILSLIFILSSITGVAQTSIEKFPIFSNCESVLSSELSGCFYEELYVQLQNNYDHPKDVSSSSATIRFEVNKDGEFIVITLDSKEQDVKNELRKAFNSLPKITPPSYNGNSTFMQFVINTPVPLVSGGSFVTFDEKQNTASPAKNDVVNDLDSIAFAKANNDYQVIKSNKYTNQELLSNAIIPFSYQRYAPYEAAMNKIGTNAHSSIKPYTFNQVGAYFDLEAQRSSLTEERTTWLGRKWWNEHFFRVAGDDYWFVIDPGVDLQLGKDFDADINTFNNTRLAMVNGGIGKQITFGATIQESQGRFADYFNREITLRAPDGGNPGIVPGRGIAEDGGENIYDYPVATGYINYKPSKYFDLQLGHGQHFIGDGYRSLILSDNSMPFPYFKVNANFWKLNYTVLYTSLRDVRSEVTADDSFRTKFMTFHYLSWNATKRLNIGLFESVLWQDDNQRGFDFNYINPIIFYQAIELQTGSRGGNALIGATAKYKFTNRITGYGQLVFDEFSSDAVAGGGSFKNKSAFQLGVKWQNAFINGLMLQAEYNRVRPFTYSHNSIVLNYGNSNQALAHPWGANFYEMIFIGRYDYKRWYGIGKVILGERGYDILSNSDNLAYGGNIYTSEDNRAFENGNEVAQGNTASYFYGQIEAGYLINPASNLKVYAQLIYRDISPQVDNVRVVDQSTTWFNIGLRTDIMNWSYDR
ncbi:hypothetical protein [Nonlabens tegetincola]|uniref:hypothetical protein n=1 Tax=Nonlabens tegetincola TaxID=323273 RepID=UPI000D438D50|nr:hypothetical protein [Nonlabens tegetincola]PQJ20441.1 hypothetical protein BST93_03090 [Nonlabens tegetincola]